MKRKPFTKAGYGGTELLQADADMAFGLQVGGSEADRSMSGIPEEVRTGPVVPLAVHPSR